MLGQTCIQINMLMKNEFCGKSSGHVDVYYISLVYEWKVFIGVCSRKY